MMESQGGQHPMSLCHSMFTFVQGQAIGFFQTQVTIEFMYKAAQMQIAVF